MGGSLQPWKLLCGRLTGEQEYQQLSPQELKTCRSIVGGGGRQVSVLPPTTLAVLYKRDLVYLDVPIRGTDHVSIPPLEVSLLSAVELPNVTLSTPRLRTAAGHPSFVFEAHSCTTKLNQS